jgi:hypothetical protein
VSTTPIRNRQKGIKDPSQRKHADKVLEKIEMSNNRRLDDINSLRFSQQTQSQSRATQLGLEEEAESLWIKPNIPTFNSFGYLHPDGSQADAEMSGQNEAEEKSSTADDVNKPKKSKNKPKPIYIKAKKYTDVQGALKLLKIDKYGLKIISGGIKLTVETVEDFKTAKKHFADSNTEFYTYDLEEEKLFKVVLYGLPVFECDEVIECLNEVNVHPKEVKRLQTKVQRDDSAIYMVSFPTGQTNISELKKVRFVNYISVSWAHYVRRGNITQCRRCQQFNHGTRNCHISPKCVKCGEAHLSNGCPHDEQLKSKQRALKCANCGEQHPANYSECSVRLNYIEYREKLAERDKFFRTNNRGGSQPQQYGQGNNNRRGAYRPAPTPTNNAWTANNRNLAAGMNTTNTNNTNNNNQKNTNLFTPSEIMQITNDVFSKMYGCKTKADQVNVIIEICSKYVFNVQP